MLIIARHTPQKPGTSRHIQTNNYSLVVVIVVDLDCWCDFITITSSYGAEHATVHETI